MNTFFFVLACYLPVVACPVAHMCMAVERREGILPELTFTIHGTDVNLNIPRYVNASCTPKSRNWYAQCAIKGLSKYVDVRYTSLTANVAKRMLSFELDVLQEKEASLRSKQSQTQ